MSAHEVEPHLYVEEVMVRGEEGSEREIGEEHVVEEEVY